MGAGGKEEEIDTALSEPKAKQIYPGLVPGGEAGGWTTYITGTGPGTGRHALLSAPFFRFFVFDFAPTTRGPMSAASPQW